MVRSLNTLFDACGFELDSPDLLQKVRGEYLPTLYNFTQSLLFCRETFTIDEPVLFVPKLYINIPSCVLRVVDNDTGDELPRVFMRVVPRVLQKNKVFNPTLSLCYC